MVQWQIIPEFDNNRCHIFVKNSTRIMDIDCLIFENRLMLSYIFKVKTPSCVLEYLVLLSIVS